MTMLEGRGQHMSGTVPTIIQQTSPQPNNIPQLHSQQTLYSTSPNKVSALRMQLFFKLLLHFDFVIKLYLQLHGHKFDKFDWGIVPTTYDMCSNSVRILWDVSVKEMLKQLLKQWLPILQNLLIRVTVKRFLNLHNKDGKKLTIE